MSVEVEAGLADIDQIVEIARARLERWNADAIADAKRLIDEHAHSEAQAPARRPATEQARSSGPTAGEAPAGDLPTEWTAKDELAFGKSAGRHWSELSVDQQRGYAKNLREGLADPSKARYHAENRRKLAALIWIAKGGAPRFPPSLEEQAADAFAEDDIPF